MGSIRSLSLSAALLLAALLFPALALAAFTPSAHIILKQPAEGSVVSLRPDMFSWHDDSTRPTVPGSNPPHAAPYLLRVGTDPGFPVETPTVFPIDPLPPYVIDTYVYDTVLAVAAMHAPLSPNTTYYWAVSIPADSGGDVSVARGSFITEAPPLSPDLVSPADGEQNVPQSRAFVWNKSDRATQYRLQVAFDNTFTTGVQDTLVNDTTGAFPPLAGNHYYYWRVRGEISGVPGAWSLVRLMRTDIAPPAKPVVSFPAGNAVNLEPTVQFSWPYIAGVDSWNLQVATDTSFAHMVYADSTLNGNVVAPLVTGLDSGVTYYWRLRGKNLAGVSPWLDGQRFTVVGQSPRLIAPENGAEHVPLRPTFKWASVPQASSYGLVVAELHYGAGGWQYDTVVNIQSGLTDTVYQSQALRPGHDFVWYAGAATSMETSFSDYHIFTEVEPVPGRPLLKTPAKDSQTVDASYVHFLWDGPPVDSAHGQPLEFQMQVATDTGFTAPILDSTLGLTLLILEHRLQRGTHYYWRARATNGTGPGDWSGRSAFTTFPDAPATTPLISPAPYSYSEPLSPTLLWHASAGAARYEVAVSTFIDTALVIVSKDTITDTSITVGPLKRGILYVWTVSALNGGGAAPPAFGNFRTLPDLPGKVILTSPEPGETKVPLEPTLLWKPSEFSVFFRIMVSTDSGFSTPILDTLYLPIDSLTLSLEGLANDTRYYWRIRSENAAGPGPWSDVSVFTTVGSPTAILPKEFTLRFLDASGGSRLSYSLPEPAHVTVRLYDFRGVLRAMPLDGDQPAGIHELSLAALPRGVYYLSFRAGGFRRQTQVILER